MALWVPSLQCLAAVLCTAYCEVRPLQCCPCVAAQRCPLYGCVSFGLLCCPAVLSKHVRIRPLDAINNIYCLQGQLVNWSSKSSALGVSVYEQAPGWVSGTTLGSSCLRCTVVVPPLPLA